MFTGSGASTASAMASFEAAAGGGDNGTAAGEEGSGYRHATWDQIALDGTDPGSTTIASGVIAPARSRLQPWGLDLGPNIAVSDNGFQSVSSTPFTPFSAPNVWGPFNSDDGRIRRRCSGRPGRRARAGADAGTRYRLPECHAASTMITYYNGSHLCSAPLPAPTGTTTSFAGLLFPDAVVTRVVVTLGRRRRDLRVERRHRHARAAAGSVAGDDIVLAEPGPKRRCDRRRADLAGPRHGHRKRCDRLRFRRDRLGRRNPDRRQDRLRIGRRVRRDRHPCLRPDRRAYNAVVTVDDASALRISRRPTR